MEPRTMGKRRPDMAGGGDEMNEKATTEQTFNQTSYDAGRRDLAAETAARGNAQFNRFARVLLDVEYPGMDLVVRADGDRAYLQARFRADDQEWGGRKWLLSPHMTKSEVVQTALKAVLTAVEHEAREHFLYRGRAVFGPHYDVDALHEIAESVDERAEVEHVAS